MRKVNPNDVRAFFVGELDSLDAYFKRVSVALTGSPHENADLSQLSETTFLTAYVGFERFVSDLFLAYLNRNFSAYQGDLESRIRQSATDKHGEWAGTRVRLDRVDHIPVAQLEEIVDPDGWNLTFSQAIHLKDRADRWLTATYRDRIAALTDHDIRLIDTARAIRHFIAHQSPAAKQTMNESLSSVDQGPPNSGLGRGTKQVHHIGSFLKSWLDAERRVVTYIARLRDIAARM